MNILEKMESSTDSNSMGYDFLDMILQASPTSSNGPSNTDNALNLNGPSNNGYGMLSDLNFQQPQEIEQPIFDKLQQQQQQQHQHQHHHQQQQHQLHLQQQHIKPQQSSKVPAELPLSYPVQGMSSISNHRPSPLFFFSSSLRFVNGVRLVRLVNLELNRPVRPLRFTEMNQLIHNIKPLFLHVQRLQTALVHCFSVSPRVAANKKEKTKKQLCLIT